MKNSTQSWIVLLVLVLLVLLVRREGFDTEAAKKFIPGYVKKGIKTTSTELGAATSAEECAGLALAKQFTGFTYRNGNHRETKYKNTCVGFNIDCIEKEWKRGQAGGYEIADTTSHTSGCTNGGLFPICIDTKHCAPNAKFLGIPLKWF